MDTVHFALCLLTHRSLLLAVSQTDVLILTPVNQLFVIRQIKGPLTIRMRTRMVISLTCLPLPYSYLQEIERDRERGEGATETQTQTQNVLFNNCQQGM
jgi:hypothetical protein